MNKIDLLFKPEWNCECSDFSLKKGQGDY